MAIVAAVTVGGGVSFQMTAYNEILIPALPPPTDG